MNYWMLVVATAGKRNIIISFIKDTIAVYVRLFVHLGARSQRKNVFWPPAFSGGIGAAFQILDIQQYASGLKLGPAAILNQNPIFEMASYKHKMMKSRNRKILFFHFVFPCFRAFVIQTI